MGHESPAFEATLLYKTAPRPDLDRLVRDIEDVLDAHGAMLLSVEHLDGIFTLLSCDTVQVLLAFTDSAMPIEHFLDTHRPATADLSEPAMLARLTAHTAAATVMVMNCNGSVRMNAAHETLKRNICWDVTETIFQLCTADLVFWNETDTLFSDAEFERTCIYLDHQSMIPENPEDQHPSRLPVFFETEPMINLAALDWLGSQIAEPEVLCEPGSDEPDRRRLDTWLSLAIPNRLALQFDRVQNAFDVRGSLNAIALACTAATIAMTSLPNLTTLLV